MSHSDNKPLKAFVGPTANLVSLLSICAQLLGVATTAQAQPVLVRTIDDAAIAKAPALSLSLSSMPLDDGGGRDFDLTFVRHAVFLRDGTVVALASMGSTNLLGHFESAQYRGFASSALSARFS